MAGLTDANGPSSGILAQVGFGAPGSDPGGWTTWRAMDFNVPAGNNYEYLGTLRPRTAGTYDLLVRFSTDGGLTWAYGDQDGFYPGEPGTDQPGVLTVNPSDDTTAPAAPTDLEVTDWGAAFIELGWTAPPDPDVAEYGIYRDGGGGFELIATVPVSPAAPGYRDESVTSGIEYTYRVTAFDGSLNESGPSNEVTQTAEPKLVQVTFRVRVPASTPPGDTIFLPGNIGLLGPWNPGKQAMANQGGGIWEVKIPILDGTALEYKYTRGTWDRVEWWGSIVSVANRLATISYGTNGTQLIDDTSTAWDDATIPDGDKAVRYWRDPLVVSAIGDVSGATVTFERDIVPDGADYSNSVVVTLGGSPVAGAVAETSTGVLTWAPSASLSAGDYSVTVANVRSSVDGDSVPMQVPYVFAFTVP